MGKIRLCRALMQRYSLGIHQDIQQGECYPHFRFYWRKPGDARGGEKEKVTVAKTGS